MPSREISKNRREIIRVTPSRYMDHDLVDIRIFAPNASSGELGPTKKGVSLAVDLIPELIDALFWALGQPCSEDADQSEALLSSEDADRLAQATWTILRKHGSSVHWDSLERMVLNADLKRFSKWNLHQVLATRNDLFERAGSGCFKAKTKA
jgi:hypothetical protein